jgi:hypothetical protein
MLSKSPRPARFLFIKAGCSRTDFLRSRDDVSATWITGFSHMSYLFSWGVMCNSSRQIFQEKRMLCAGLTSLEYILHPFPYCIIELSCRELLHRRTNGRFKIQASLSPRSFPRRVKHNCPGVRINKELNTVLPWCEMLIVSSKKDRYLWTHTLAIYQIPS